MKKFALIVAGGSGTRMKQSVPKQLLELVGKPVLMHTFSAFSNYDKEIEFVLVLPPGLSETWKELCKKHHFNKKHKLVPGGGNRFQSVKNGLDMITGNGIVFIHDGVRPLVSANTIENCYQMTLEKGNALPVIPVSESVRMSEGTLNQPLDRSRLFLVQTPQTFLSSEIKNAYKQTYNQTFTDDATVLENAGRQINLVKGNRENIKITYPEDLLFAEALLHNKVLK